MRFRDKNADPLSLSWNLLNPTTNCVVVETSCKLGPVGRKQLRCSQCPWRSETKEMWSLGPQKIIEWIFNIGYMGDIWHAHIVPISGWWYEYVLDLGQPKSERFQHRSVLGVIGCLWDTYIARICLPTRRIHQSGKHDPAILKSCGCTRHQFPCSARSAVSCLFILPLSDCSVHSAYPNFQFSVRPFGKL